MKLNEFGRQRTFQLRLAKFQERKNISNPTTDAHLCPKERKKKKFKKNQEEIH